MKILGKDPRDYKPEDFPRGTGGPSEVFCPLVDDIIDAGGCLINSDIVDGMFVEECMLSRFTQKKNWKDICKKCQWHDFGN